MNINVRERELMFIVHEKDHMNGYPAVMILANNLGEFLSGVIKSLTESFELRITDLFIGNTPNVFDGEPQYEMEIKINGDIFPIVILPCSEVIDNRQD